MNSKHLDLNKTIQEYSDYLDQINLEAYQNIFLISNPTLSKNPYTKTRLLHNLLDKKSENYSLTKHIILFILKNFLLFLSFLLVYLYSKIDKDHRKINFSDDEIILIDSFYGHNELSTRVLKKDLYFHELYQYMDSRKIPYYLTPKFYGVRNPFTYIHFYRTMKNSDTLSLLDVVYLKSSDLLRIAFFIIIYPIHLIRLKNMTRGKKTIDSLFRQDLIYSLSGTNFYPYLRFLFARRLSEKLVAKKIKVISWCEYQILDKNFFRGLREFKSDTQIYATQFVFKIPTYVCQYIPEIDKQLNIGPDVILVTGKGYVPNKSYYRYKVGPALRFKKLYDTQYSINTTGKIIVMLPYVQSDAFHIIEVLKKSSFLKTVQIDFKIHPDNIKEKKHYLKLFENNWSLIQEVPTITDYSFVISSGSGSMVEMACLGLSAIIITSNNSFTSNPMPAIGYNQNWGIINNPDQLQQTYKYLFEFRTTNLKQFEENILYLRNYVLSEVSDLKIKESFDFSK